jgi:hypothetical protein
MSARTLRNALLVLLAAQAAILAAQHVTFFSELFRLPSRLAGGLPAGAGSSVPLLLGILAASAAWARGPGRAERFAVAGLVNLAAAGLAVYAAALATGRLFAWLPWAVLALSAILSRLVPRDGGAPAPRAPLSLLDALSALVLATLLVPSVFPYVAFDAKLVWAWRAYAMRDEGFVHAVTACVRPGYPPLDSILLWLGIGDPLFEGRLLPWLLLVLFAVFFRARLARTAPRLAPAGLLFLVATVHVWQGVATYYADVPLMVFAAAGSLLVLGLPAGTGAAPSRFDRAAGALCLAAAVLVRPDGFVCLVVVVLAALWGVRARLRAAAASLSFAAAAWATWALRPASLRAGAGAYRFVGGANWREAAATPVEAVARVLGIFLFSLQGQWLSHKGVGTAVYLAVLVAAHRFLSRGARHGGPAEDETRFAGAVAFLSLGAVAGLYAVFPFVADMHASVGPDGFPTWAAAYRNFANVGMGRMTVHLLPFFVLYAVYALAEASATIASSRSRARSIESFAGPNEKRT